MDLTCPATEPDSPSGGSDLVGIPVVPSSWSNTPGDPRRILADYLSHRLRTKCENLILIARESSEKSILLMATGMAVGKGANIKGKSSKGGISSQVAGYVPFIQIVNDEDKARLSWKPRAGKLICCFFSNSASRDAVLARHGGESLDGFQGVHGAVYGLVVTALQLQEAFLAPPLTRDVQWNYGRESSPMFMDWNLESVASFGEPSNPEVPPVCLVQGDSLNPFNARGLLMAHICQKQVRPVTSDIDLWGYLIQGGPHDDLDEQNSKLAFWCLEQTEQIIASSSREDWDTQWMQMLQKGGKSAFAHLCTEDMSPLGFGDDRLIEIIRGCVARTSETGAVRHSAECSNWYFPQPLDDHFLVICADVPSGWLQQWRYMTEDGLRTFVQDMATKGFAAAINPTIPVRYPAWRDIYSRTATEGRTEAILQRVQRLCDEFPFGFQAKPGNMPALEYMDLTFDIPAREQFAPVKEEEDVSSANDANQADGARCSQDFQGVSRRASVGKRFSASMPLKCRSCADLCLPAWYGNRTRNGICPRHGVALEEHVQVTIQRYGKSFKKVVARDWLESSD
eukprot:TRINITY_DN111664_c0_g1_i1.p1 TRINITY_DN111664_c0_g1~~TRINITY_DN111664_c0_g1_i1.p1  ORF type:complete len:618 (+),score=43.53 TRINITY_DN111664_c0_g1_i1:152-1855(+)